MLSKRLHSWGPTFLTLTASTEFLDAVANLVRGETAAAVRRFLEAIQCGTLDRQSSNSAIRNCLQISTAQLSRYAEALKRAPTAHDLQLALHASLHTVKQERGEHPVIELAGTFPEGQGFEARSTARVAKEIIESCVERLLVVSYSVNVDRNLGEPAAQAIGAMAALAADVQVTVVLDKQEENRNKFLRAWGDDTPSPPIYTWATAVGTLQKVHAKVLVSDRRHALVTSANLTRHGYRGNLEIGVSVNGGSIPKEIDSRIRRLITRGDLVLWPD